MRRGGRGGVLLLGVTGYPAAGKSLVVKTCLEACVGGVSWSSDEAVRKIYRVEECVLRYFEERGLMGGSGCVDRGKLGEFLKENLHELEVLESLVHPLVRDYRQRFLSSLAHSVEVVFLELPLLFELGQEKEVDYTVYVETSLEVCRRRYEGRGVFFPWEVLVLRHDKKPPLCVDFRISGELSLYRLKEEVQTIVLSVMKEKRVCG